MPSKIRSRFASKSSLHKARLLILMIALLPSVTLNPCTRSANLMAFERAEVGSPPLGGMISAVIADNPDSSRF